MILKTNHLFRNLVITGVLFLTIYSGIFKTIDSSLLAFLWFVLLALIIVIVIGKAGATRNKPTILAGLLIVSVVTVIEISKLEMFKSKKVLEAALIDDLSSIRLVMRENKKFEMVSKYGLYWSPDEVCEGEFEIQGEKIFLKNKSCSHNSLTNPVIMLGDKIYQSNGYSAVTSSDYLQIEYRDSSYFRNR